jgi:hypothetical protein
MSILTPQGFPRHQTQFRDAFRLYNSGQNRVNPIQQRSGTEIRFFDSDSDISIETNTSVDASVFFNVDFTKLTIFKCETTLTERTQRSVRIFIGGTSIFYSDTNHAWTSRVFDVSARTGLLEVEFFNDISGGIFKIRNARLY